MELGMEPLSLIAGPNCNFEYLLTVVVYINTNCLFGFQVR